MGQPDGSLGTSALDDAHDPVEAALQSLLRHYPTAHVAAVTADSAARIVPLPDDLPVGAEHPRFGGYSVANLVSRTDQAVIARTWGRARSVGHANSQVRVIGDPPVPGNLHIFDLRRIYGLMIVVFAEGEDATVPEVADLTVDLPPTRLARMVKDAGASIVDVDAGIEALLGWSPFELVGRRSVEIVHPDDQEKAIENWVSMLEFPGSNRAVRLRHRHRNGYWVWLEVHNHNRLADPDHGDVVAEMVDISEEVAAQEAVLARQQLLEQLTETLPTGLFHADLAGNLLYVNRRLTELTGLPVGSRLAEWPGAVGPGFAGVIDDILRSAAGGTPTDSVIDVIDPGGRPRHRSLSIRPLADRSRAVTGVTGAVEDVTDSVVERRELELRAASDSLTGCFNRSAVLALLQDSLDALVATDRTDGVAVIFLDVDGLKEVNDRLGHPAGDALLVELAHRLEGAVRSRDAVGRYGGDEFVVLARHVRSADHAMTVAHGIAARTLRSMEIEGEQVEVRVSLGVAWTPAPGLRAEALIRLADAAMYRSKHEGRCQPVLAPVLA